MQKKAGTTILIKYLKWTKLLKFKTFSKCRANQHKERIQKYDNTVIASTLISHRSFTKMY